MPLLTNEAARAVAISFSALRAVVGNSPSNTEVRTGAFRAVLGGRGGRVYIHGQAGAYEEHRTLYDFELTYEIAK